MKSISFVGLVLVATLTACAGEQTQAQPPTSTPSGATSAPPGAQLQGAGQGPASPEVDRGSPDCKFVVAGGRCFVIQNAACAAAGCDQKTCIVAESSPAQVSCKK